MIIQTAKFPEEEKAKPSPPKEKPKGKGTPKKEG